MVADGKQGLNTFAEHGTSDLDTNGPWGLRGSLPRIFRASYTEGAILDRSLVKVHGLALYSPDSYMAEF